MKCVHIVAVPLAPPTLPKRPKGQATLKMHTQSENVSPKGPKRERERERKTAALAIPLMDQQRQDKTLGGVMSELKWSPA